MIDYKKLQEYFKMTIREKMIQELKNMRIDRKQPNFFDGLLGYKRIWMR